MHDIIDIWDPNHWAPDQHEHRIYLTEDLETYVLVDYVDYWRFNKWRWNLLKGVKRKGVQYGGYARRSQNKYGLQKDFRGWPLREGVETILLHDEIMRLVRRKPSSKHVADHRDGNTLDCRRNNLRWVTRANNIRNKKGRYKNGFRRRKS